MDFSSFSWLAVLAAVVANMVLGFLWYGPLFGKSWRAAVGKTEEDRPDPSLGLYLVPVLSSLVGAIVLWNVMQATGLSGIMAAFWMWVGFVALTSYTNFLFEGRSSTLWAIENGNHLVGFLISGFIMGAL